jgi:methionine biosynthesis protein MetW
MAESPARAYYDAYWRRGEFTTALPKTLLELFEQYVSQTDDCLDFGCGDGGTSGPWLNEYARSYRGVDIADSAIELAIERGFQANRIDDASSLPFENDSFDVAVCVEVLEHLFEPQSAVAEIRRVLRPGGRLIATVPNVAHWRSRADLALFGRWNARGDQLSPTQPWRDPHIRFFTVNSMRNMMSQGGYEICQAGGFSEESLTEYVPGLRRLGRSRRAGTVGRTLAQRLPNLLAGNVYAVGRVPLSSRLSQPRYEKVRPVR